MPGLYASPVQWKNNTSYTHNFKFSSSHAENIKRKHEINLNVSHLNQCAEMLFQQYNSI